MVSYQGTGPGSFGSAEVWKHELAITLRAGTEPENQQPLGYYRLFRLITKRTPTSLGGVTMNNATVHASCDPMDTPTMRRQTDAASVDYFEVSITFTEIGDE
jgi:hypothetical protein